MKDLLDKISSYNLFNYLFPGIIFSVIATNITSYILIYDNLIIGAFIYYFIGLIISRVGSLIIEPILRKTHFLKFVEYEKFIQESKKDAKIELLSEVNNTYRTICVTLPLLILLKIYELIEIKFPILKLWNPYILIFLLFLLFLFSYRKQTQYINKRLNSSGG